MTSELQLRAIEEVSLDQDILGRIFDYGKINDSRHRRGGDHCSRPSAIRSAMRKALQEAIGQVQNATTPVLDPAAAPHPARAETSRELPT